MRGVKNSLRTYKKFIKFGEAVSEEFELQFFPGVFLLELGECSIKTCSVVLGNYLHNITIFKRADTLLTQYLF